MKLQKIDKKNKISSTNRPKSKELKKFDTLETKQSEILNYRYKI